MNKQIVKKSIESDPMIISLEQVILGSLMIDKDAIHLVTALLQPKMFALPAHAALYSTMLDLYEKMIPLDLITVLSACKQANLLKQIGGPAYLASLTNRVASTANLEYHCRILQQQYMRRAVVDVCGHLLKKAIDPTEDSIELVESAEIEISRIKDEVFKSRQRSNAAIAKSVLQQLDEKSAKGLALFGIPALDHSLGGGTKKDLIIVGGRPSMGKSSLVNNILKTAVLNNISCLMWSLEMSSEETLKRLASALSGVDLLRMRENCATKEESRAFLDALDIIADKPLIFEDAAGINAADFRARLITLKRTQNLRVAILDRIDLLTFFNNGNRTEEITKISNLLRRTANELDITIVALCQLSRDVEKRMGHKIPALSDLRDSGSLEQDATKVLLLYRPEYYNILQDAEGNSLRGIAHIIVAKNTFGKTGVIKCRFDAPCTQFLPLEDDFDF